MQPTLRRVWIIRSRMRAAGIKQELQNDLDTNYTKKTELTTELAKYYNKEEVDGFVTLLEGKISGIDGLAAFNCAYDAAPVL